MKKLTWFITAALAVMMLVAGCNPAPEANGPGSVRLVIDGGTLDRSIESNKPLDAHKYVITGSLEGSELKMDKVELVNGLKEKTVTLVAGKWNITAVAYNVDQEIIGLGKATITVAPGQNRECPITIEESSGEGELNIRMSGVPGTVKAAYAVELDQPETVVPLEMAGESLYGSKSIANGSYILSFTTEDSSFFWIEAVRIVAGGQTNVDISVDASGRITCSSGDTVQSNPISIATEEGGSVICGTPYDFHTERIADWYVDGMLRKSGSDLFRWMPSGYEDGSVHKVTAVTASGNFAKAETKLLTAKLPVSGYSYEISVEKTTLKRGESFTPSVVQNGAAVEGETEWYMDGCPVAGPELSTAGLAQGTHVLSASFLEPSGTRHAVAPKTMTISGIMREHYLYPVASNYREDGCDLEFSVEWQYSGVPIDDGLVEWTVQWGTSSDALSNTVSGNGKENVHISYTGNEPFIFWKSECLYDGKPTEYVSEGHANTFEMITSYESHQNVAGTMPETISLPVTVSIPRAEAVFGTALPEITMTDGRLNEMKVPALGTEFSMNVGTDMATKPLMLFMNWADRRLLVDLGNVYIYDLSKYPQVSISVPPTMSLGDGLKVTVTDPSSHMKDPVWRIDGKCYEYTESVNGNEYTVHTDVSYMTVGEHTVDLLQYDETGKTEVLYATGKFSVNEIVLPEMSINVPSKVWRGTDIDVRISPAPEYDVDVIWYLEGKEIDRSRLDSSAVPEERGKSRIHIPLATGTGRKMLSAELLIAGQKYTVPGTPVNPSTFIFDTRAELNVISNVKNGEEFHLHLTPSQVVPVTVDVTCDGTFLKTFTFDTTGNPVAMTLDGLSLGTHTLAGTMHYGENSRELAPIEIHVVDKTHVDFSVTAPTHATRESVMLLKADQVRNSSISFNVEVDGEPYCYTAEWLPGTDLISLAVGRHLGTGTHTYRLLSAGDQQFTVCPSFTVESVDSGFSVYSRPKVRLQGTAKIELTGYWSSSASVPSDLRYELFALEPGMPIRGIHGTVSENGVSGQYDYRGSEPRIGMFINVYSGNELYYSTKINSNTYLLSLRGETEVTIRNGADTTVSYYPITGEDNPDFGADRLFRYSLDGQSFTTEQDPIDIVFTDAMLGKHHLSVYLETEKGIFHMGELGIYVAAEALDPNVNLSVVGYNRAKLASNSDLLFKFFLKTDAPVGHWRYEVSQYGSLSGKQSNDFDFTPDENGLYSGAVILPHDALVEGEYELKVSQIDDQWRLVKETVYRGYHENAYPSFQDTHRYYVPCEENLNVYIENFDFVRTSDWCFYVDDQPVTAVTEGVQLFPEEGRISFKAGQFGFGHHDICVYYGAHSRTERLDWYAESDLKMTAEDLSGRTGENMKVSFEILRDPGENLPAEATYTLKMGCGNGPRTFEETNTTGVFNVPVGLYNDIYATYDYSVTCGERTFSEKNGLLGISNGRLYGLPGTISEGMQSFYLRLDWFNNNIDMSKYRMDWSVDGVGTGKITNFEYFYINTGKPHDLEIACKVYSLDNKASTTIRQTVRVVNAVPEPVYDYAEFNQEFFLKLENHSEFSTTKDYSAMTPEEWNAFRETAGRNAEYFTLQDGKFLYRYISGDGKTVTLYTQTAGKWTKTEMSEELTFANWYKNISGALFGTGDGIIRTEPDFTAVTEVELSKFRSDMNAAMAGNNNIVPGNAYLTDKDPVGEFCVEFDYFENTHYAVYQRKDGTWHGYMSFTRQDGKTVRGNMQIGSSRRSTEYASLWALIDSVDLSGEKMLDEIEMVAGPQNGPVPERSIRIVFHGGDDINGKVGSIAEKFGIFPDPNGSGRLVKNDGTHLYELFTHANTVCLDIAEVAGTSPDSGAYSEFRDMIGPNDDPSVLPASPAYHAMTADEFAAFKKSAGKDAESFSLKDGVFSYSYYADGKDKVLSQSTEGWSVVTSDVPAICGKRLSDMIGDSTSINSVPDRSLLFSAITPENDATFDAELEFVLEWQGQFKYDFTVTHSKDADGTFTVRFSMTHDGLTQNSQLVQTSDGVWTGSGEGINEADGSLVMLMHHYFGKAPFMAEPDAGESIWQQFVTMPGASSVSSIYKCSNEADIQKLVESEGFTYVKEQSTYPEGATGNELVSLYVNRDGGLFKVSVYRNIVSKADAFLQDWSAAMAGAARMPVDYHYGNMDGLERLVFEDGMRITWEMMTNGGGPNAPVKERTTAKVTTSGDTKSFNIEIRTYGQGKLLNGISFTQDAGGIFKCLEKTRGADGTMVTVSTSYLGKFPALNVKIPETALTFVSTGGDYAEEEIHGHGKQEVIDKIRTDNKLTVEATGPSGTMVRNEDRTIELDYEPLEGVPGEFKFDVTYSSKGLGAPGGK